MLIKIFIRSRNRGMRGPRTIDLGLPSVEFQVGRHLARGATPNTLTANIIENSL